MRRISLAFLIFFPLVWAAIVVALLHSGLLGVIIAAVFVANSMLIFLWPSRRWRRGGR